MAGVMLPEVSSEALNTSNEGLMWRVVARAARHGDWSGWDSHLEGELAEIGDDAPKPEFSAGGRLIPLLSVLQSSNGSVDADEAVGAGSEVLCRGLGLYLEALPTRERIRSAGRIAKVLHLVHHHTRLEPFAQLSEVPERDQTSIWDATLRLIASQDQSSKSLTPWLQYATHVPDSLRQRWLEQLEALPLRPDSKEQLEAVLTGHSASGADNRTNLELVTPEPPYVREVSPDSAPADQGKPDYMDFSDLGLEEIVVSQPLDLETIEPLLRSVEPSADLKPRSETVAAVSAHEHEIVGAYSGKPLPRFLRVATVLTGLIVVISVVRVVVRFVLGARREGRLTLNQGGVGLEVSTFFMGREMRRTRFGFGPEGILSVAKEVRYPYIYMFLGLTALCLGALTGTMAFLDGQLAGFETWMQTGLMLILGGLVLDFLLTVIGSTRPGRTTLIVTYAPKNIARIGGVDEDAAELMLDALVEASRSN